MDVLDLFAGAGAPFRPGETAFDPANPQRCKPVPVDCELVDCREVVMEGGEQLQPAPPLAAMADYCCAAIAATPGREPAPGQPAPLQGGVSRRLLTLRMS